jgi:hypothetical protein
MQEEGVKGSFLGCVWRNTGSKLVSARKARHKQEPSRPAGWRFVGLATAMTAAIGPGHPDAGTAAGAFGPIWAGHSIVDRWTSAVHKSTLKPPEVPSPSRFTCPKRWDYDLYAAANWISAFPKLFGCIVFVSIF